MSAIYEQHDKAFANVSAYVILDSKGDRIATVAIKFPRDGAGRLWAYVQLLGVPMVRGNAGGYGYDKRSAAVAQAIGRIPAYDLTPPGDAYHDAFEARRQVFRAAASAMDGEDWTRAFEKAGFRVLQAV